MDCFENTLETRCTKAAINKIADYVIPEDNPTRERIGEMMGGQILKLRSEELREEGRTLEIYAMVQDGGT